MKGVLRDGRVRVGCIKSIFCAWAGYRLPTNPLRKACPRCGFRVVRRV